eukprot:6748245-Lingulodinium_polyedra.AAC.1
MDTRVTFRAFAEVEKRVRTGGQQQESSRKAATGRQQERGPNATAGQRALNESGCGRRNRQAAVVEL